jgi:hypothetical protein
MLADAYLAVITLSTGFIIYDETGMGIPRKIDPWRTYNPTGLDSSVTNRPLPTGDQ